MYKLWPIDYEFTLNVDGINIRFLESDFNDPAFEEYEFIQLMPRNADYHPDDEITSVLKSIPDEKNYISSQRYLNASKELCNIDRETVKFQACELF